MADGHVRHPGIECPTCGHGTRVVRTENFVSWIRRTRMCRNSKCRHVFSTVERMHKRTDELRNLFSGQ